ncbi:acetyltransferase [Paenibacillus glacialis]|uniref:Acetyltransferase n=2 Tax=Paenibacillus glacialis TaxID=494026 RepID=A0A168LSZ8_9BACL|nr:acetyltransferase [Paenibacillus glacialis]
MYSTIQATIEDMEEVILLFDQYRIFYGQDSDTINARIFISDRFDNNDSVILLARDTTEGAPIGFVQMYPSFSSISMRKIWILNDLFVIEKYRRQGVAQSLLDAATNVARITKAKGIELSTASDNVNAQRLYERNGFRRDEVYYYYSLEM